MIDTHEDYSVTFTGRERADLVAVERDSTPLTPTEVAGRTLVSLISAGTELAGYRGLLDMPHPGYAAVFEVEGVGRDVDDVRVGERAFCMGPHRSSQRVRRDEMLPLPPGLASEEAVFARLMGVTMSTLTTTAARPPAQVLVTGLGLVGHLAARIFALCGYDVIGCDPLEGRRALLTQAGLKRVVAAPPLDDPRVAGHVALVVECSGHEQAALDGCAVVRKRGEVVLVGVPWAPRTELSAHDLLHAVFHNYVVLRSGWEWELPRRPTDNGDASIFGNLTAALRWLAEGRIAVDDLYTTVSPQEAQRAYQDLLHNRIARLGLVFDWADSEFAMG